LPRSARAEAPAISWQAPSGCPDQAAAREIIEQALGSEAEPPALEVQAKIEAGDAGYHMALQITSGELRTHKRFFAARCATLAELIGLELALSGVPDRQLAEPRPARVRVLSWGGRVLAGTGTAPVPGWAVRAGLGVWLGVRRLRFELLGGYDLPREQHYAAPAAIGARFDAITGQARVCHALRLGRLELPICAALESGMLRAEGLGLEESRRARRGWAALGLTPGLRFPATGAVSLWLELGAFVGLYRPVFTVRHLPSLYRPDLVAFRSAGGVQLQFD